MSFHTWIQFAKNTAIDHKIELFFQTVCSSHDGSDNPMINVYTINKMNNQLNFGNKSHNFTSYAYPSSLIYITTVYFLDTYIDASIVGLHSISFKSSESRIA